MKKKKVLFMIGTLLGGGAEKILCEVIKHLNKEVFDVTVQTVYDQGIYINEVKKHATYKTIFKQTVSTLEELETARNNQQYLNSLCDEEFSKAVIDDVYDVEVAFLEDESTKIIANSPNSQAKKIAWVHTDMLKNKNAAYFYPTHEQQLACYETYDDIVFVSNEVKEAFKERFKFNGNFHVINNPINTTEILHKANEEITLASQKFSILTVGRLTPTKGLDRLLIVHRQLIQEGFDYELLILGEGEQRQTLEQFVIENGLSQQTKILGFQSNPYPYMKHADLLVSPSYAEGFSTVIAEALILGTPVVITRCSGSEELVGDSEYGLVVENDIQKLYEGIRHILTHTIDFYNYKKAALLRAQKFNLNETIQVIERVLLNPIEK